MSKGRKRSNYWSARGTSMMDYMERIMVDPNKETVGLTIRQRLYVLKLANPDNAFILSLWKQRDNLSGKQEDAIQKWYRKHLEIQSQH